jgi:hypothetical protein
MSSKEDIQALDKQVEKIESILDLFEKAMSNEDSLLVCGLLIRRAVLVGYKYAPSTKIAKKVLKELLDSSISDFDSEKKD